MLVVRFFLSVNTESSSKVVTGGVNFLYLCVGLVESPSRMEMLIAALLEKLKVK